MNLLILVSLLSLCSVASAGNLDILAVVPHFKSHLFDIEHIASRLKTRGYNITFAMFRGSELYEDVRQRGYPILEFDFPRGSELSTITETIERKVYSDKDFTFDSYEFVLEWVRNLCSSALSDQTFTAAVSAADFKLSLVDGCIINPCFMMIPFLQSIPMVAVSPSMSPLDTGNPVPPSILPHIFAEEPQCMTFLQRVKNTLATIVMHAPVSMNPIKGNVTLLHTHLDSWTDLYRKVELFISLRDHHLAHPIPAMPHTIFLPGISYQLPKPLPREYEEFLQKQAQCVIVSFGSTVKYAPKHITEKFIRAFREFPSLGFIFKFSGSAEDFDFPANVLRTDWLPQNDLLGHPKTALFITHGGNNGVHEAAFHGVPVVSFPLFGDHHINSNAIVVIGLGRKMKITDFTVEELSKNIREILSDQLMKDNCKRMSAILKSYRHPAERAADAVEHVIHFGSKHLKGVTMTMPLYQIFMLDIIALLLTVVFVIIGFIYICCKCCCCKLRKPKKKTD